MTEEYLKDTGARIDPRTEEEKCTDWEHDIVCMVAGAPTEESPVLWEEKTEYKFFDKRNQLYSLSCMAQSGVKMLGMEQDEFVTLSAKPVYMARTNSGGGMFLQESLAFLTKALACLESDLPSQNMNEAEINSPYVPTEKMKSDAEKFRAKSYVFIQKDMDKIARVIDQDKGVQIMLYFLGDEYWKNIPNVIDSTLKSYEDRTSRHGVTIVDRTLYNGQKAFIVEDSAGNDSSIKGNGQRIITEDFFMKRCFGLGYIIPKPKSPFVRTLKVGRRGEDVKELQKIVDAKPVDGIFGPLTKKAVIKFQLAHDLVGDGIVGPLTTKELNKILNI